MSWVILAMVVDTNPSHRAWVRPSTGSFRELVPNFSYCNLESMVKKFLIFCFLKVFKVHTQQFEFEFLTYVMV